MTMTDSEATNWLARSRDVVAKTKLAPEGQAIGRVEQIADGIARISGLPDARLNELLNFEGGGTGFALTLDADSIGAVLLDESVGIEAGSRVTGTGGVVQVPVGPSLLGRIIDPLGRPLDGGAPVLAEAYHPVERPAPAIIDRDLVSQPVETGILVVDALFALGRGQRELIIGDHATGKTAIAVDTIINQRNSDIVCVYVAIGQRTTAVERVIEAVRQHGAPERCIFIVASSAAPAGMQWIAPFTAMTVAEYFRDRGGHGLVVIDDLSKHAATHRELALLTREPPGREAYPGDIFYLHARLLERAAKLSPALGSGSLTVLPIAETDAGNMSAYIPTNLISITDGQIVLDSRLFAANQRPAVDVGLSVSRIGGKAQHPALRDVAGRIRLDYSQFLELEMFTRFGGMSDGRIKTQIARGERIRALLAQPRFAALRTVDQIALLAALGAGVLDALPLEDIAAMRAGITPFLDTNARDCVDAIAKGGTSDETLRNRLVAAVRSLMETMLRGASPDAGGGS
ncbi:F0F1 ATP synthase subunit alpha [Rhizobium jaguaris]|uniref:F0F1 ATP synthase subunit alpha n=1 Tax=Rhizobium jaguaris TaxID=1312183 RepID=UPI0039BFB69F